MPCRIGLHHPGLKVNIGLTPLESIVATTRLAAHCPGWEDQVGTMEAGKLADILVVKINPLQDIRSLEDNDNITFVMKDGKTVKDQRGLSQ